jgi:hypothetical protein
MKRSLHRFRIEPVAQADHSRPTDRLFQRYSTWEAPALVSIKDKTVERYSQDKDKKDRGSWIGRLGASAFSTARFGNALLAPTVFV